MTFDPERVRERVKSVAQGQEPVCGVCGSRGWLILDIAWALPCMGESGTFLPVVCWVCKRCGRVLFFNAVISGAQEPEEAPDEGPG